MKNFFKNRLKKRADPASDGFEITPDDNVDLQEVAKGFYVGNGGDVIIMTPYDTTLTFLNVQSGATMPWAVKRVLATGTTASGILGATK